MTSFYTDHWKEIEPERLERYDALFQFRPEQEPFLDALNLGSASRVLDFGCGPGYLAEEMASRTGAEVVGADLNATFVEKANARNRLANLTFVHLSKAPLVDDVGTVNRVFCKNVLEYVPDLHQTLSSFYAVLDSGGEVVLVDSDWGFVLVEPWGKERTDAFFSAASGAFREPMIGRKLPGALTHAGFEDIRVKMLAGVDLKGRGISVLQNMVSYIREFGTMTENELTDLMSELEASLDDGRFMFILPQFIVSARKS